MKEPYGEGLAAHLDLESCVETWQQDWRSVDRGSASRAIELRKKQFPRVGVMVPSAGNTVSTAKGEVLGGAAESLEPERAWTLHGREPRDPGTVRPTAGGPVGEGETVLPTRTGPGSRTDP